MGGSENTLSAILAPASSHAIAHWLVVTEFGISDPLVVGPVAGAQDHARFGCCGDIPTQPLLNLLAVQLGSSWHDCQQSGALKIGGARRVGPSLSG